MIRVLVVDDSAISRRLITKTLEVIPDVQVIDTASDGQEALKKTVRLRPDLITLDLAMPNMDGFTFLRWVMGTMPTPVIVVSAQEANENVFKALDLGAMDFVVKPFSELDQIHSDLMEKVLAIPLLQASRTKEKMESEEQQILESLRRGKPLEKPQCIAIAASTGGPPAIQSILQGLPLDWNVPLIIAQHMPRNFTALFAERLNRSNTFSVREASHGESVNIGHVYIAPGGKHVAVVRHGHRLQIEIREEPREIYQPSGDVLFQSLAEAVGSRSVATVLTGMGCDGAKGLAAIKGNGGITIAESERTAAVFGMPNEAIRTGMVDYVLPLQHVATAFKIFCC